MPDPSSHPCPKSDAPKAKFRFGQNTGESTFHLSIIGECGNINVQFDREDARRIYECFGRCLEQGDIWRNQQIPEMTERA